MRAQGGGGWLGLVEKSSGERQGLARKKLAVGQAKPGKGVVQKEAPSQVQSSGLSS